MCAGHDTLVNLVKGLGNVFCAACQFSRRLLCPGDDLLIDRIKGLHDVLGAFGEIA